ncbi:MAG: hypothetical protein HYU59_02345 [Magnetospirillum gryphiswaldense]|nr:hypothetical protein [Magnetospirillum gryphiswaldense]
MTRFTVDTALILRSPSDAAETATAAETGVALDVLKSGAFHCVIDVLALDTTSTNETYKISLETDVSASFGGTPVEVAAVTVTATGRYILTVDQDLVATLDPDAAAIRVKATLGGTTPSLSYGAFLAPVA